MSRIRYGAVVAVGALVVTVCAGCAGGTGRGTSGPADSPPAPAEATGIAFVSDGRVRVIEKGEVRTADVGQGEVVAIAATADRLKLLVTLASGARRSVVSLDPADGSHRTLASTDEGSAFGAVRSSGSGDGARLYRSSYGDPGALLFSTTAGDDSGWERASLEQLFSGEFDVDGRGTLVYTGTQQNPAVVIGRERGVEHPVKTGLATAFSPALSAHGAWLCLTGSSSAEEPMAVWLISLRGLEPVRLEHTAGRTPTYPVFSPDGASVAFRSGADGTIWIAPVDGRPAHSLGIAVDDTPIAWTGVATGP